MVNSLFIYIPDAHQLTPLELRAETVTAKRMYGGYAEWDYCRLTFETPEDCEAAKTKLKAIKGVEILHGRTA